MLLEIFCQVFARSVVFSRLEAIRVHPRHYCRASMNPALGFELAPEMEVTHEGHRLYINRYGIRKQSDDLENGKRKIAILGDSVAFGMKHSQENTISALVQNELDPTGAKSFMPLSSDDLIPYRPFTGFIKSLIGASNGSRTGGPIEVNSNLSK